MQGRALPFHHRVHGLLGKFVPSECRTKPCMVFGRDRRRFDRNKHEWASLGIIMHTTHFLVFVFHAAQASNVCG